MNNFNKIWGYVKGFNSLTSTTVPPVDNRVQLNISTFLGAISFKFNKKLAHNCHSQNSKKFHFWIAYYTI